MNLLEIRTAADVRAFLHVALPSLSAILVLAGYFTSTDAGLWGALALVVVDTGLSAFNSATRFRAFLYPFLGVLGALLVRYGVTTDDVWALWAGLAPVLFGGGVAAANVQSTGRHALK